MEDSTFRRHITFIIIFLSLYAISIAIHLVFFNDSSINSNSIYSDISIGEILFLNAIICLLISGIIMFIYQQRTLRKSRVITENAVIIDKDISVYIASYINNGGGGQIRKDLVVRFKLGDDTEVDLAVDEEHYLSAINDERVKLSYKNCYDSYIFIDFERINDEN